MSKQRVPAIAVAVGVLGLLLASGAWAAKARLTGKVTDQAGEGIGGARVTVTSADGEVSESVLAAKSGKFSLRFDDADKTYTIRVEAAGFDPYEGPLELRENQTLEATFPLLTAAQGQEQRAQIAKIDAHNRAAKLYNQAATLHEEGDVDGAIAKFHESIEENDQLAVTWGALGQIHLERGDFPAAVEAFEHFNELEPGKEPALALLYDAYMGADQTDEATEVLKTLIAEHPGQAAAARLFNRGVVAIQESDLDTARSLFEQALDVHPDLYQAHLNLAHILRAFGEWEASLEHTDSFLVHEPSHARGLALRYQMLKQLERTEDAAQALAALQQASPGEAAVMFFEQGVRLFNDGEVQLALDSFQSALEVDPSHARAHYRAGLCYASAGDNAQAKTYLEKFIELAPDDPEVPAAREMLSYFD